MTNTTPAPASPACTTAAPTPDLDPRPQLLAAVDLARSVVAAVRPDQRTLPTPCEDLDVETMCGHLLAVIRRIGHLGRGGNPFDLPGLTDVEPDGGWLAAWDVAMAETAAVWQDDTLLMTMVQTPWATVPGWAAIDVYVNEFTVHTWDLATATGQQPHFDPAVLAVALHAMERTLPAEGRIESFELVFAGVPDAHRLYPFAEAVAVDDDAPLIERLVAFNGRTPVR